MLIEENFIIEDKEQVSNFLNSAFYPLFKSSTIVQKEKLRHKVESRYRLRISTLDNDRKHSSISKVQNLKLKSNRL
jgi:hypothetical protein